MPLDDTNWSGVEIHDLKDGVRYSGIRKYPVIRAYRPARHTRIRFENVVLVAMGTLFLGALACVSEAFFPDAGLITRITCGNAVANRNYVGHAIFADSQKLKFSVAGYQYEVDTPSRALTFHEQQAFFGYAEWKGWPRYSADGPLTIDP